MARSIRCRAGYEVRNLLLNPTAHYEVGPCGEHRVEIHLWQEEIDGKQSVVLTAYCDYRLNSAREEMLESLEQWKLPAGSTPDPTDTKVAEDGTFAPETWVRLDYLPNSLQTVYHEVRDMLDKAANRLLRLLRWRYRKEAPFTLRGKPGLFWESKDKSRWYRFPSYLPKPSGLSLRTGMSHHQFVAEFLSERLSSERDEPLGHRLLQDASVLAGSDPRAAIVLAVTAMEIGVKEFIAAQVPKAQWLAFHAPTPSVEAMIREYLADLSTSVPRSEFESLFSHEWLQRLKKHVKIRNDVAHTGMQVTHDQAAEACDVIRELLFRLDYLRGEAWAKPSDLSLPECDAVRKSP